MKERIEKQLEFALEIDKVKNIFRQTHISGYSRNENDAEHSWHMAVMAYLLKEYANEKVDIAKVMFSAAAASSMDSAKLCSSSSSSSRYAGKSFISSLVIKALLSSLIISITQKYFSVKFG